MSSIQPFWHQHACAKENLSIHPYCTSYDKEETPQEALHHIITPYNKRKRRTIIFYPKSYDLQMSEEGLFIALQPHFLQLSRMTSH